MGRYEKYGGNRVAHHQRDKRSAEKYAAGLRRGKESEMSVSQALMATIVGKSGHEEQLLRTVIEVQKTGRKSLLDMTGVDAVAMLTPDAADMIGAENSRLYLQIKSSRSGEEEFIRREDQIRNLARRELGRRYETRQVMVLCGRKSEFSICSDFLLGAVRHAGLPLDPNDLEVEDILYEFGHPILAESTYHRIGAMWEDPRHRANELAGAGIHGAIVELPVARVGERQDNRRHIAKAQENNVYRYGRFATAWR